MCGDHPVLADDTLQSVQFAFLVFLWCVGGEVDVPAEVVEAGLLVRGGEATPGVIVQVEFVRNLIGAELRSVVEVDPEQLRSAQPIRPIRQLLKLVNLVSVEENRAHAPQSFQMVRWQVPPRTQGQSSPQVSQRVTAADQPGALAACSRSPARSPALPGGHRGDTKATSAAQTARLTRVGETA